MITHGPFTAAQLAEQGIGGAQVRELLAQGRLRRVGRVWLADGLASSDAIRAVELGGRLGCVSACRQHGVWVPPDPDLHVVANPGADLPARPRGGVQFHRLARTCSTAVVPVEDAVAQVLHRHDLETGLVVLESAVNLGLIHEAEARHLLSELSSKKAREAHRFSPLAQSGSETRVRLFFQRHRVPVQPQAVIPGVGRVDLLVGRSWIVEADSGAHHGARRDVMVDRHRDLTARELGYDTLRLSYEQIWHVWERTQASLLAHLRTRRHLRPPVPLHRGH